MGWANDHEKRQRRQVAIDIGRQEFWKEVYLISMRTDGASSPSRNADRADDALSHFDKRFNEE